MLPHSLSPLPFLHKGGGAIRFFKNGLIGGREGGLGIFGRNGGKPGMAAGRGGGWFWNGWDGKLLKSLYISRWLLTPLFYKDPLYCSPLLFQLLPAPPPPLPTPPPPNTPPPPPSHFPVTSNTYPHCSFNCPVSLAEWVIMPYLTCCFT